MSWLLNLRIGQKFGLMGALGLALCLPLMAMLVRAEWSQRDAAQQERAGLPVVSAVLKLVRDSQVHRGLSGAALAGNAEAAGKRQDQAPRVDQALKAALDATAAYPDPRLNARRQELQTLWQALRADVDARRIDGATSFRRHNQLVQLQLRLLADVADNSTLILDPEAASYHLVALVTDTLPRLTEMLGQTRALGAAALQSLPVGTAQRTVLQANLAQIDQLQRASGRHFDQAFTSAADFQTELGPLRQKAEEAVVAASGLVQQQLVQAETPSTTSTAYFQAMTEHIDAQFKVAERAFGLLQTALDARVASIEQRLLWAALCLVAAVGLGVAMVLTISRGTLRSVRSAQAALQALGRGELDHVVAPSARDEAGQMAQELGVAMQQLAGLVSEIKSAGSALGAASAQIASGNADLSSRTEQAAGSVQQAASSLEQITATVQHNADSARQAAQLAGQASTVAANGGELIGRLVATMDQISHSSQRIADITGVIDGIAFQTNILALNAAVEAARAGDAGRGFAVVASEVRALAQRSAQAAREIKSLIGQSVDTVDGGARLVGDTRQTMHDIVAQAREVSTLVAEIGDATAEQASGIAQVNHAVGQLEQSTQQNAALVEESAAKADSLRQQAERLVQVVGRFRVAETA